MLVGAVHGYRGLMRELIGGIETRIAREKIAGHRDGRLCEIDRGEAAGDFRRRAGFNAGRFAAGLAKPILNRSERRKQRIRDLASCSLFSSVKKIIFRQNLSFNVSNADNIRFI